VINILIPMAGTSSFFPPTEHYFPKPLIDVRGKPMVEAVVESFQSITRAQKFMFVINRKDNVNFFLGNTVRLLCGDNCRVVEQRGDARGALCSALLLIDDINNDTPLLISNSDQVVDVDFEKVLRFFEERDADAGTVVFNSVHPQWSFVRMDENGLVNATAEKRPISNHAIAGLYYFKTGKNFVDAAFEVIRKGATLNGKYFLSSAFNELILKQKRVVAYPIEKECYHSFFSPQKIEQYNKAAEVR